MLAICASTSFGPGQARADSLVRSPLSHQTENLALAWCEIVERSGLGPPGDQLRDDLGVDDGPAAADAPDRVREVVDVLDPVLEEVAHASGAVCHEPEGICGLRVLGEDEDADRRSVFKASASAARSPSSE